MSKAGRTRDRLQREALRLFVAQGYDETTVAEIAAAAGVTQMTFFRHFPAKELVVVEDPYDPAIAQAVVAQPADLTVLERIRRGLLAAWGQISGEEDAEFRLRLRVGAGHPAPRPDAGEHCGHGGRHRRCHDGGGRASLRGRRCRGRRAGCADGRTVGVGR
jgi:AcrR family transcriptional regulator